MFDPNFRILSSGTDLDIVLLSGISETGLWSLPRSFIKERSSFWEKYVPLIQS